MIINIIDENTVEVFGEFKKEAIDNSDTFAKFIGIQQWKSSSAAIFGTAKPLKKYKVVVTFKEREGAYV